MAWPTTFANLAGGNQPLSLFDTMFNQVAQMVAIPTTAAGVNALTLTPIGTAPALANYQNFSSFRFVAAASVNAPVTAQYQALGLLPVYLGDGVTQATTGSINSGQEYVLVFVQALNAGAGGFFVETAAIPAVAPVAGSALTNLLIVNNSGTPNTQVNVSYDELVMNNLSGGALRATGQSFTINAATAGVVNGIDIGALGASTWYAVWGISNGTTTGGLLSLSFTAPTMPAGYTFKKRIGAWLTDGSSHFYRIIQKQRSAQYQLQSAGNTTAFPNIATGSTANVVTAEAITFAPPSAIRGQFSLYGNGAFTVGVGPNTNMLGAGAPSQAFSSLTGVANLIWIIPSNLVIESSNVYYVSGTASSGIFQLGWEDSI